MVETTKRIVIADDESLIRMDLRQMLTGLGYLVVGEAADGQTAVNVARETRPDVVIMDIKMPQLDGIEAARQLTVEAIAPVVLLTAYSQRDLIDQALAAGVIKDLKEHVEVRKVVERAKGVLMDLHGLKEADAFRRIQKLSMDSRKSMKDVAEAILLANQV
jgi:response regulator NasT